MRTTTSWALAITIATAVVPLRAQDSKTGGPAASVEVVNDKRTFDLQVVSHTLLLTARGSAVGGLDVRVVDFARGAVGSGAIEFGSPSGTAPYQPGATIDVPITVHPEKLAHLGPGNYELTGRLQVRAERDALASEVPFTMTFVRVERLVEASVTPLAFEVRRVWPFTPLSTVQCLQLTVSPRGRYALPTVAASELMSGTPPHVVSGGAPVTADFSTCATPPPTEADGSGAGLVEALPPLAVHATLPAGTTSASVTLRMQGQDLRAGNAVVLQFNSKDLLVWPLFVVLAGVCLSRWVHSWIESGRAAALNLMELTQLADDLQNLEALHPGRVAPASAQEVRTLLAAAARRQARGEGAEAASALAQARTKFEALVAGLQAAPGGALGAPMVGGLTVDIETPVAERTTGRNLVFRAAGVNAAGVTWEYGTAGAWSTLDVVADGAVIAPNARVTTRTPFRQMGLYGVRAVAAGAASDPVMFRVEPALATRILNTVRRNDALVDLIAGAIAGLLTVAAISELTSFGTFRDYVLQFASVFGVTESVKGLAQTLAAVRRV